MAHSTLGFVFGLQVGRPGWFSALQAPEFVVLAGVSGIGLLIVIAALLRRALGAQEKLSMDTFKLLSNFLLLLIAVYMYFLVVDWLTSTYAASQHEAQVSIALLSGEYAWLFWLTVVLLMVPLVLLAVQFIFNHYRLSWIVLSGLLVNVAAIVKRYLIVVPSQTHGALLPYDAGTYSPTWVEYFVILGLIALGTLLFVLFIKVFPIMEVPEITVGGE